MENFSPKAIDQIVSKVITVWIWTILFATCSAELYSSFGMNFKSGLWTIMGSLVGIGAIGLVLMAWYQLYLHLSNFILPELLPYGHQEHQKKILSDGVIHLKTAFFYLLLGAGALFVRSLLMGFSNPF